MDFDLIVSWSWEQLGLGFYAYRAVSNTGRDGLKVDVHLLWLEVSIVFSRDPAKK
jgi:hypothetical protein